MKEVLHPFTNLIMALSNVSPDLETLLLEMCKPDFRRQMVCVVYRLPSGSMKSFVSELGASMNLLEDNDSSFELTLIGDFKINYKKTNTIDYKHLKAFERNYQLKQYIMKPTRVTNKVKSTIDLIMSNKAFISGTGVLGCIT